MSQFQHKHPQCRIWRLGFVSFSSARWVCYIVRRTGNRKVDEKCSDGVGEQHCCGYYRNCSLRSRSQK